MACYYPMQMVRYGSGDVEYLGPAGDNPMTFTYRDPGTLDFKKFFTVPCGKCIGCRLEYSRQWAVRCMNELKTTEGQSWFLTITYDNDHLPRRTFQAEETGVRVEMPTLRPKDLQDFFKRLRERLRRAGKPDIRYYACGEYGDELKRPHYHAIVFNLNLDDLVYYKSIRGHEYYNSSFLDSVWANQGFIVCSDVSFEACAYVARYVMKKAKGPAGISYASDNNLEEEFVRMSRRPGIGYQYFLDHKDEMYKIEKDHYGVKHIKNDSMGFYPSNNGPIKLKPVKYYDKLFDVDEHLDLLRIKASREMKAKRRNEAIMSNMSITSGEYRLVQMRDKEQQLSLLHRDTF